MQNTYFLFSFFLYDLDMFITGMIITKKSNGNPMTFNNKKLITKSITKVNTSAVRTRKETCSVSFTPSGEQRWQDPWGHRSGP